jgi:hypothetical protein
MWGSTLTSLIGHGSRSPRLLPWQCWIRVEGHVQFRLPWSALTARKETLYVSLAKTLTWDVVSPFFSPSLPPSVSLSLGLSLSLFLQTVDSAFLLLLGRHFNILPDRICSWRYALIRCTWSHGVWPSIGSNLHSSWISCAGFSHVSFLKPMVSLNQWFLPMVFFMKTLQLGMLDLISASAAPWGYLVPLIWVS